MAGVKGLEPSTYRVTGDRSNQLSYTPTTARDQACQRPLPKRSRRSRTSPLTCQAVAASSGLFFVIFPGTTTWNRQRQGRVNYQDVTTTGDNDRRQRLATTTATNSAGSSQNRHVRRTDMCGAVGLEGKMVGGEGLEPPTYSV